MKQAALHFLASNQFEQLLSTLKQSGYHNVAPQVVDDTILYRPLKSLTDLPQGTSDQQGEGRYTLNKKGVEERGAQHIFSWANGPQALKPLLFPPQESLWRAEKESSGKTKFMSIMPEVSPTAVIGVKNCDLAALQLLDNHFLGTDSPDPWYRQRRESLLLISVNCTHPSDNCFCVSTHSNSNQSGPEVLSGYDLNLHELDDGFLIQSGSEKGEEILSQLTLTVVTEVMVEEANSALESAVSAQKQQLATTDFRPFFKGKEEAPQWQQIAEHCLACGNCTAVCPSCFCHREEEIPSLDLAVSNHQRLWDSCFNSEHSMLHGIPVRSETTHRYRQWMMHKLAGWHDQFGESGCVGCGRCITWCPVGINIVTESARFAEEEKQTEASYSRSTVKSNKA